MFCLSTSAKPIKPLFFLGFLVACGAPQPPYAPAMLTQLPVTADGLPLPGAKTPPRPREKVAVLPLEDDELFRAERAALRMELAGHLMRLGPNYDLVPLPEVDAKISPVSNTTGHLCAFEGEPWKRRAENQGWKTTEILHVAGILGESSAALWVTVSRRYEEGTTFEGSWNPTLPIVERYRASFSSLVRNEGGGGILGGIGTSGNWKNAVLDGTVSICETKPFGECIAGSADWKDHAAELQACFPNEDEKYVDLIVQGDGGGPYCEIEELEWTRGREGARENCLCRSLVTSMGMHTRPGRRSLRVHFEAKDIVGRPRPELRVIETSTNIHAEDEWHSIRSLVEGKTVYQSVRRLSVDNLDRLAAPLARCSAPAGSVVVADLDVREDGFVQTASIVSGPALEREAGACIENALGKGMFSCTDGGKAGRVRIAIEMPPAASR